MDKPKVFFVLLRRPRRDDVRTDPLYEYGSFGCTKCHSKNLMHPVNAQQLTGARLAFVQGGNRGWRLVFVTPPITVKVWRCNCEARWKPRKMPFKYAEAPLLLCNEGRTDFPAVMQLALSSSSSTVNGKPISLELRLSSKLRSRITPLPPRIAMQVVRVYEQARRRAERTRSRIASTYDEALPYATCVDRNRKKTYQNLKKVLGAESNGSKISSGAQLIRSQVAVRLGCRTSRNRSTRC